MLYGDSFAGCVTPPAECWEGLVAGSELAADFHLLNYGVGGYGIDQTYLLFRESIDVYAGQRPVVVISILVDDDLDRASLRFRGGVKPHFTLGEEGELVLELPSTFDDEEWLAENPSEIWSYAWRYLLYGTRILPDSIALPLRGRGELFAETRRVSRAILKELRDEVRRLPRAFGTGRSR